jgi:hypothetical protein
MIMWAFRMKSPLYKKAFALFFKFHVTDCHTHLFQRDFYSTEKEKPASGFYFLIGGAHWLSLCFNDYLHNGFIT